MNPRSISVVVKRHGTISGRNTQYLNIQLTQSNRIQIGID